MDEQHQFIFRNIQAIFDVANERILTMKKGMKNGAARIEKLHKAGFHLEALMVNGQLIEHAIKNVLFMCRLKRDVCQQIGLPDPYPVVQLSNEKLREFKKNFENFDRKTLGKVIGLLRLVTEENGMADELEKFNGMRIETIHHAFNGIKDLEDFDVEALKTVEDMDYKKAVVVLGLLHQKIQAEIMEICNHSKNETLSDA
jgi:hypothetical protein